MNRVMYGRVLQTERQRERDRKKEKEKAGANAREMVGRETDGEGGSDESKEAAKNEKREKDGKTGRCITARGKIERERQSL